MDNFARVCDSLAACQRHTPSSLVAVIGLSINSHCVACVISIIRKLRKVVACVAFGWKPGFTRATWLHEHSAGTG